MGVFFSNFKKYKLIYRLYYWIIYVRNCGIYIIFLLSENYVFVTWWQTRVCETFSREFVTILFLNNLNLFLRQEYLTYSGLTRPLDELQQFHSLIILMIFNKNRVESDWKNHEDIDTFHIKIINFSIGKTKIQNIFRLATGSYRESP